MCIIIPPSSGKLNQFVEANQPASEKLAYTNMLEQYRVNKNSGMVKKFEQYTIKEPEDKWLQNWFTSSLRDNAMHDLGVGTMHNMKSVITDIFFQPYTVKIILLLNV